MECPLVISDQTGKDICMVSEYSGDFAFGSGEQNFEISFEKPLLKGGELILIDGTEYGGIVREIETSTKTSVVTYRGRTWHGMLADKVVPPDKNSIYNTFTGWRDMVNVTQWLVEDVKLFPLMTTFMGRDSGASVKKYQFRAYRDLYTSLKKFAEDFGKKLMIRAENTIFNSSATPLSKIVLWYEPIRTIMDVDSDVMDFTAKKTHRVCNHLICRGKGEREQRDVVHLYADKDGKISQTQTLFGLDEIAAIYDYTSAEHAQLIKDGTKRLLEAQTSGSVDVDIRREHEWYIGDVLTATDHRTGVTVSVPITKKIARVKNGVITVEYQAGDKKIVR